MSHSDTAPVVRDANGRFARGNPGRPFGTRNRVSRRVTDAILADFEAHQDELLPRLRRWFMPQYLALVGRLLPRPEAGEAESPPLSEAELTRMVRQARAALDRLEAGEGSLADLEAALLGAGPDRAGADVSGG